MKHGITIREKKTKTLVKFIECPTGITALKVLSGVRHNLGKDYEATEDFVDEEEIEAQKTKEKIIGTLQEKPK